MYISQSKETGRQRNSGGVVRFASDIEDNIKFSSPLSEIMKLLNEISSLNGFSLFPPRGFASCMKTRFALSGMPPKMTVQQMARLYLATIN